MGWNVCILAGSGGWNGSKETESATGSPSISGFKFSVDYFQECFVDVKIASEPMSILSQISDDVWVLVS